MEECIGWHCYITPHYIGLQGLSMRIILRLAHVWYKVLSMRSVDVHYVRSVTNTLEYMARYVTVFSTCPKSYSGQNYPMNYT